MCQCFVRVLIVSLADSMRRPFLGDEVEARVDLILTVWEEELHPPSCVVRWVRTRKFDNALMCFGTFCTSFQRRPSDSQVPRVQQQWEATRARSARTCRAESGCRGFTAAKSRSIRRPIERMPAPCISRLRVAGLPQASGNVSRTADQ